MDLQDADCQARYLIRDRDGRFPELFDTILADAGIEVVLSGIRIPRMNSIMERWVQTCRRELLARTLIWNQRHLLHALREFEQFYNAHRPHQGIANARPLHPLPEPITDPDETARLDIHRTDRLGGLLRPRPGVFPLALGLFHRLPGPVPRPDAPAPSRSRGAPRTPPAPSRTTGTRRCVTTGHVKPPRGALRA
ncbi:integrase core domain-containing protein [Streptomyces mirabilis]|uniref:integrase core domain-containing protein n=1 Tax=Streptomyces mirabilis TaxID=68239 RepID=UPI00381034FD